MSIVLLSHKNREQPIKFFTFPGGEEHCAIIGDYSEYNKHLYFSIIAKIQTSQELIRLGLLKNALDNYPFTHPVECNLILPYIPYARQDRVCNGGEPLSIQFLANYINSLKFRTVEVWDAHSDVSLALINNVRHVEQGAFLVDGAIRNLISGMTLISPDAGALKKCYKISHMFQGLIKADKVRNTVTGEITGTEIHGNVLNKECLIVDDICDGGRTFIELSKELYGNGAKTVDLFITHGIFSKGLDPLFKSGIKRIFTTDSIQRQNPFGEALIHLIEWCTYTELSQETREKFEL